MAYAVRTLGTSGTKAMTVEELREWIRDIERIVIDINIAIKNAERLRESKYDFEEKIKRHGFFKLHTYQLNFIIVIQLCKLLSQSGNQKRSFYKLFNILENEKPHESIEKLFEENEKRMIGLIDSRIELKRKVLNLRSRIIDNNETIEKVVEYRDKIFAHKDPSGPERILEFKELHELTILASEIYNELRFGLFYTRTELSFLEDWSIDSILYSISQMKIQDDEERRKKLNYLE